MRFDAIRHFIPLDLIIRLSIECGWGWGTKVVIFMDMAAANGDDDDDYDSLSKRSNFSVSSA